MRVSGLVRDQAGRLSALKSATLLLLLLPGLVLLLQWSMDDLGPRPNTEVIHGTGLWAIRLLMISLAVTPARIILEWPRLIMLRRIIGVSAAFYAIAHLLFFIFDHKWN